jgi:hypothetical protein
MSNQIFKLLVGISLCSALPLTLDFTNRAWADVRFPVAEVGSSLAGKISVPLFLPESLPLDHLFHSQSYTNRLQHRNECYP